MKDETQFDPNLYQQCLSSLEQFEHLTPPSHEEKISNLKYKLDRLKDEEETGGFCTVAQSFARSIAYTSSIKDVPKPAFFSTKHPISEINDVLDIYRDRLDDQEEGFIVRFDYHLAMRLLIAGWNFTRATRAIAEVNAESRRETAEEYQFYADRVVKTVYKNPLVRLAMEVMAQWKLDYGLALSETNLKKLKI